MNNIKKSYLSNKDWLRRLNSLKIVNIEVQKLENEDLVDSVYEKYDEVYDIRVSENIYNPIVWIYTIIGFTKHFFSNIKYSFDINPYRFGIRAKDVYIQDKK